MKTTVEYKFIDGIDKNLLSLDIYHFEEINNIKPVVVYVHGGGLAIGDKIDKINNKINLFSDIGYIFVSVNYQLSPKGINTNPERIIYPTHNNDFADAIKWIFENINKYGGNKEKIVLIGHSSGAYLVSIIGTSELFLPKRNIELNRLKGIISIDTSGYNIEEQCKTKNDIYLNAFGNNDKNWKEASPIYNLKNEKSYPPFFIAKRGNAERIELADVFVRKLKSVGVKVKEVIATEYEHEEINDVIGEKNEEIITKPILKFIKQCFSEN